MPPQVGSCCIQRQFHDFKEESDFSSVLRGTLSVLQLLLWDTLRQNPKSRLHCPGHSHALEMGTVSTCLFPMFDCKFEILLVSGETPDISLANSTIYMYGMYSITQRYFR